MAKYYNADTLLEFVKNTIPAINGHTTMQCVERAIKEAPTADVKEVKRGHWIWLEGNLYECSECPAKTEVDEKMNEPLYKFCPYCGAEMVGDMDGINR